ncbi:MAG TPA: hypothetical protein PK902_08965 [Actinomycetota bacterium]|nr:hypothetical protein [Actinomycetota bacterium]
MIRSFIEGVIAVLLAVVMGVLIALGLTELGLTDTPWLTLGPWLAGAGLLGAWQQEVSTELAGGLEWATTASGAPLLVTWVAALYIALRAKRSTWVQALPAAVGAAAAAALLVAATRTSSTVSNDAGSVTTSEGLTWLWSGDRPGTVIGAAALVAVVWLLQTAALRWWRSGRGVAWSLLLGLGIVLTAAVAGGLYYLTSSLAVGLAVGLLYPLAGTLALFGIAGAPVEVSLTRLTPESLSLMTWSESLVYGIGGTVAALVLALLVGLVMRIFKHRSTWLGAITVTAALAAFLGWAMSTVIDVPPALGADTKVWVNPLFAAGVGAVLGLVTRFFAGQPKDAPVGPPPSAPAAPVAPAADNDIEALLAEVGETKAP